MGQAAGGGAAAAAAEGTDFFEDVSGIQELTETNPDEHPNSVSRSSAQK